MRTIFSLSKNIKAVKGQKLLKALFTSGHITALALQDIRAKQVLELPKGAIRTMRG